MRKALLLFAALLVAGCGEKSSSEGSESASEEPSGTQESLSDADIERLLKEAVDSESLLERDGLIHHDDKPYSGWVKGMRDSGQAFRLVEFKDGKPNGLMIEWHENGQKRSEGTATEDGSLDGPVTMWHENGQKAVEGTWKDGEEVSAKYWNSKGEEVETYSDAFD